MGNSLTADCRPLSLDQIAAEAAQGAAGTLPDPGQANLKVWRICGRGRHVTCEGVDMVNQELELDELSTYLILVLKRKNGGRGGGRVLPESIAPVLSSTFTPRGLKCPFYVASDASFSKLVYIYYGKLAGALPKAKALKHGLDVEKLLQQKGACERLYSAGGPVDVDTPSVFNTFQREMARASEYPHRCSVDLVQCLEDQAGGGAHPAFDENSSFASSFGGKATPHQGATHQPPVRPAIPALKFGAGAGDVKPPLLPLAGLPRPAPEATSPSSSDKSAGNHSSEVSSSLNEPRGYCENPSITDAAAQPPSNPRPGVPVLSMPRPVTAGVGSTGLGLSLGLNIGALSADRAQGQDQNEPSLPARQAWGAEDRSDTGDDSFQSLQDAAAQPSDADDLDEKRLHHQREQKMRDASRVCSEILPHLLVSGQAPAECIATLMDAGITDIVNTAASVVPDKYPEYFHYTSAKLKDTANENIMNFFPRCVSSIEAARARGGKCLVHCHQGVSRSVTLCAAYLMWKQGTTSADDAVEMVRKARDIARPNAGFLLRLNDWGRLLSADRNVTVYCLQSLSEECPIPIFALASSDTDSQSYTLMSSSVYLITSTAADQAWSAPSKTWLWVGPRVPDAHAAAEVAKGIAPEVLKYTVREGCGESGRGLEAPIVKFASITDERSGEVGGCRYVVEDAAQAVQKEHAQRWTDWMEYVHDAEKKASPTAEAARQAKRNTSSTSTTMQMELLNVKEVYLADDGHVDATDTDVSSRITTFHHDPRYSSTDVVFDDDEFADFADSAAHSAAVFVKLRKDDRVVDVWFGPDCAYISDRGAAADAVYEAFKAWSMKNTPWGGTVDWATVQMGWVVDGLDENADVHFSARWVSS
eukprot:TRINITY_DN6919_c0_g1_i1.p1 TRINITY_DN6919_c0_g1~~TRINITY_DN6919_c0_g1_i1.p1  ORF type:complete len:873 (+),score=191.10 TRINITY_DN6919_c0_g1_i1:138-2756(+)